MSNNTMAINQRDAHISETALHFRRASIIATFQLCKEDNDKPSTAMYILEVLANAHVRTVGQLKKALKGRLDVTSIIKLATKCYNLTSEHRKSENVIGPRALMEVMEHIEALLAADVATATVRSWAHHMFDYACEIGERQHKTLDEKIDRYAIALVRAQLEEAPAYIEFRDAERVAVLNKYSVMGFAGLKALCVYVGHRKWANNSPEDVDSIMELCCKGESVSLSISNEIGVPKNILLPFDTIVGKFDQWVFWITTSYCQKLYSYGKLDKDAVKQLRVAISCISSEALRVNLTAYLGAIAVEPPRQNFGGLQASSLGGFNW